MIDLTTILITLIPTIVINITGFYYFTKKLPLEKSAAMAEANQDNATASLNIIQAGSTFLESYNRFFALLMERDDQIVKQSKRIAELSLEVDTLRSSLTTERRRADIAEDNVSIVRTDLANEVQLRQDTVRERDILKNALEDSIRKTSSLEDEMSRLRTDVNRLQKAPRRPIKGE